MGSIRGVTVAFSWRYRSEGLFALLPFSKGDLIFELSGEPIHRTSVGDLTINRRLHFLQIDAHEYLDLDTTSRRLRHSCNPNCFIRFDRAIVAAHDIAPTDELTLDYSTTMDDGSVISPCRCGEQNCRKGITDFKELPELTQQYYLENIAVSHFIMERIHG